MSKLKLTTSSSDFIKISGSGSNQLLLSGEPIPVLTITAASKSKTYGSVNPTLTATYSGFVGGDGPGDLDTLPSLSTTATTGSNVGTYTITASGAVSGKYIIVYATGTLTVNTAALTITVVNKSKTYGSSNPTLTATYSGFVNGDTSGDLDTPVNLSTAATTGSNAGTYTITASGATDANYAISFVNGTLTVNTAALTITADNKTKVAGDANPTLTASYSGFVNGDDAGDLDTPVSLSTTATTGSPAGTYSIVASGAADSNYTISFVNGTLTVAVAHESGYGYLYNGYAAQNPDLPPTGWHLPENSEFDTLRTYIGATSTSGGGKLKETGLVHWNSPNTAATDEYGWTGLGGGLRGDVTGNFSHLRSVGYWWTNSGTYNARVLNYDDDYCFWSSTGPLDGQSIKFVKDTTTLINGQSSTVSDVEGNVYDTICIGTQEWTVQNWKCTKLNNGTSLTKASAGSTWLAAGPTDYYYVAYNDDDTYI